MLAWDGKPVQKECNNLALQLGFDAVMDWTLEATIELAQEAERCAYGTVILVDHH